MTVLPGVKGSLCSLVVCGAVLALAGSACAGASQGPARSGRGSNVITRAELDGLPSSSAYDAVQRLRPQWLSRPNTPSIQGSNPVMIYVDRHNFGALESLRSLNTEQIEQMEFVPARDATTRYGTGHASGVIEVTTRRG
ncbi:MAG: hypothetical protein HY599_07035 [Candidatus Omnitrophica bacterium]|nr:hypothetical protein [Candidatus Omnitrophota bacterium]